MSNRIKVTCKNRHYRAELDGEYLTVSTMANGLGAFLDWLRGYGTQLEITENARQTRIKSNRLKLIETGVLCDCGSDKLGDHLAHQDVKVTVTEYGYVRG